MLNLYNEKVSERPIYHHYPQSGLLNDPNGLIQWEGVYHLFYQLNPYGTTHQTKCWGHSTSRDLVHWQREPIALRPTEWFDKDGCYSGSAIAFEGTLYLFYTGNVIDENNKRYSYQCLATSIDGITFQKHGPIIGEIEGYTAHVRDPKVWQTANNEWKLILGAQRTNQTGCLLVYSSQDLLNWSFEGELVTELTTFGYMWECPDLIDKQANSLLIFSPQGLEEDGNKYQNIYQSGYLVGDYQETETFLPSSKFTELDQGFEFYAPQTFTDEEGRLVLYGWMGAMKQAVEQSLPSISDGWAHMLTVPRELIIRDNKVYQRPVRELVELRKKQIPTDIKNRTEYFLESYENEVILSLLMDDQDLLVRIYQDLIIQWKSLEKELTITRTNWYTKEREERSVYIETSLKELHMYLEKTSLELFINEGQEVFSLRMYHQNNQPSIKITQGQKLINELTVFQLGY